MGKGWKWMRLTAREAKVLGIKIPGQRNKKKPPKFTTLAVWDAETKNGVTKITVPYIPPSLNQWKNWHWSKQKQYKDQMYLDFNTLKLAFKVPNYVKCNVTVTYFFSTHRQRDLHDNYNIKFLGDALVNSGILLDDNSELVKVQLEQGFDKERPRTEIIIEAVEK